MHTIDATAAAAAAAANSLLLLFLLLRLPLASLPPLLPPPLQCMSLSRAHPAALSSSSHLFFSLSVRR
jgi:hypothetical protein